MSQLKYESTTENYDFRFSIVILSVYTKYWKVNVVYMGEKVWILL